ncbi:MAG: 6-phosphogluconolactonase [Caldimonas sp.]
MQHASPPQQIRWHSMPGGAEMDAVIAAGTLEAAARAVQERGRFLIVLAGGNTPRGAYEQLRTAPADWSRWHVYFGDERCVARADDARNSRMAALAWLDQVPIPRDQRHEMVAELGPTEAARRYNQTLAAVGEFDLVLLGLGDDGHTGSLFPGHPLGAQPSSPDALAVFDAPRPPPQRVTLSAARFSRTRQAFFLVAGEDKREAVARWVAGAAIPAAWIRPPAGVDVFVDARAR